MKTILVFFSLISFSYSAELPLRLVQKLSPTVIYHFNEGPGGTPKNTITGVNTTLVGGTWVDSQIKGSGYGLQFTGTINDGITIQNVDTVVFEKDPRTFCMDCIIRDSDPGSSRIMLFSQGNWNTLLFCLNVLGGKFQIVEVGATDKSGSLSVIPFTRYWVCADVSGGTSTDTFHIYVNGKQDLVYSANGWAGTPASGAAQDKIDIASRRSFNGGLVFVGTITETIIFKRILSASEHSQLYNWIRGQRNAKTN